jgi:thiol-disulfide isomerase/thioredoxin
MPRRPGTPNIVLAPRALIGVLALCLAGCAPRAERGAETRHTARVAADSVVVPVTVEELRALAARGDARATIVNVWATWCLPCRHEFPALLKVARAHAPEGLRLVLVSTDFDDQLPAVKQFLATQGVVDTSYIKSGDDMAFINGMDRRWTGALPATFVFDHEGRLQAFWEGAGDEARFESAVTAALTNSKPGEARTP